MDTGFNAKFEIKTDKVFLDFKKHFKIEGNNKILFSAKYGTGKSYFLEQFFNENTIAKEYNKFTISPVNYVISSNEDIIDLIKVDIIKQLYLFETINFNAIAKKTSSYKKIKRYIKANPLEVVKNLSSCVSKISGVAEALNGISNSVINLIEDFEKFDKNIEKENEPVDITLLEYSEVFTETKNSYLEHNFITQLISAQLNKLKTKNKQNKQNVLLIEDFDRLDPAHIFRILNILSAHSTDNQNKFGFDKVIIVCDLQNIKSLYMHLYGESIDFDGYIDKFYTVSPYTFDNTKAIHFYLKNYFILPVPDYAINAFSHLLKTLDINSKIRLRKFDKSTTYQMNHNALLVSYNYKEKYGFPNTSDPNFISKDVTNLELYSNDVPLILLLKFLKNLYGGYDEVLNILELHKHMHGRLDTETSLNYVKLLAVPSLIGQESEHNRLFFKSEVSTDFPEINFGSAARFGVGGFDNCYNIYFNVRVTAVRP